MNILLRALLLLALFALTWNKAYAEGQICKTHKLYCAIMKLQPESAPYAMELSNYIYKYSKKYGTDPYISIAIAMQESGLRNIHRSEKGIEVEQVCAETCRWVKSEKKVYTDFGIFQFHYGALEHYNINFHKVYEHNLEYIVENHIKILHDKIKMCSSFGEPWGCYHSATERHRKKYISLVSRYFNKIKP